MSEKVVLKKNATEDVISPEALQNLYESVGVSLRPIFDMQNHFSSQFETLRESLVPVMQIQKTLQSIMPKFPQLYSPETYERVLYTPPPPVTADEVEEIVQREVSKINSTPKTAAIELYLSTNSATLCSDFQRTQCLDLSKANGRITLLELLSDEGHSVETPELRTRLYRYYTSDQSLRKAIQDLNHKCASKLGLPDRLILGKRNSGYRLNPRYKLIVHK